MHNMRVLRTLSFFLNCFKSNIYKMYLKGNIFQTRDARVFNLFDRSFLEFIKNRFTHP